MYCSEVGPDDAEVFSRIESPPPDSCQRIGSMELVLGKDAVEPSAHVFQREISVSRNTYDLTYHDPENARLLNTLCQRIVQWLTE